MYSISHLNWKTLPSFYLFYLPGWMTVSSFCLICYETLKKNVFVILPLVLHVVLANTEHIGKQAKSWIEHALFVKRKKNNNISPPESLLLL